MQLKKLIIFFILAIPLLGSAQFKELSPIAKFSILTVGTGEDLASKFGHTAIRIQDQTEGFDIVFGYGGFDFSDPLFYVKYTTGKLEYSMNASKFDNFMAQYKYENRWVSEQQLDLSIEEKAIIFNALTENYKPENRNYKYDFLFDNCATRIPEIFKKIYGEKITYNYSHLKDHYTFRQLIHQSLDENAWATFGIDLALGAVIDRKATPFEHQFLPIYVSNQLSNTTINGKTLAPKNKLLFKNTPSTKKPLFVLTPVFWGIILLLGTVFITYTDFKKQKRTRWLDVGLHLLTGLAGLLICFLWFATDHTSTKVNLNMLWAFPMNIILAFVLRKKSISISWLSYYLWALLLFIGIVALLWLFKIQVFSPIIIFILVALTIRYLFLLHYFKRSK